jgi:hypothetical protein
VSVMWSGPGRALQFHLDLFRYVDRAHTWIDTHAGGVTVPQLAAAPPTMRQRLRLMSSMAAVLADDGTVNGVSVATQRDSDEIVTTQGNINRATGLVNTEYDILNRGETHYVSHHIMATVAAAADQCGDEPLFPTDLPAQQGLIVFEYPLLIPDLHPDTGEIVPELEMPVRAIAWGQSDGVYTPKGDGSGLSVPMPGIFYALYTDAETWRALFVPSIQRVLPDVWAESEDLYTDDPPDRDPFWCVDSSGWTYAIPWRRSTALGPTEARELGETHQTVAYVRRFLLALWRFQWQRILIPETYRPSRHETKRAHRAGLALEDGYVKVLRLRRHVEAEARGEHVDAGDPLAYDHQWLVRGHPRRQWFPSLGPARNEDGSFNVDSHRLIWIEPHTKGNPYAPLVVGHNVTAVVR